MTTRHLVDPELLPILDMLPDFEYSMDKLASIREQFDTVFAMLPPAPENGVTVSERHTAGTGTAPPVRMLVFMPPGPAKTRPALFHIHGGGYFLARPEQFRARYQNLAAVLDCVVVSVDYRLPPEHPHPAPIEDCYAALKWLHGHAAELGVNPAKIAVIGESAGGGLAAALALLARDRKEVPIAFQCLIYPMLDDRTATTMESYPNAGEFGWTKAANRFGWEALLGCKPGGDNVPGYASPARANDLRSLPPAFISVGELDLFIKEDVTYALRLMEAGVSTELHVYPGAFHGFDMVADARVSLQFERDLCASLQRALH